MGRLQSHTLMQTTLFRLNFGWIHNILGYRTITMKVGMGEDSDPEIIFLDLNLVKRRCFHRLRNLTMSMDKRMALSYLEEQKL